MKHRARSAVRVIQSSGSALDPIQIVRRYTRLDDREIVAFVAAGLAFGRVASVMASVEAMCAAHGPAPGAVRARDSIRTAMALRFAPLVHRWTRGDDLAGLLWILRHADRTARIARAERSRAGSIRRRPTSRRALEEFSHARARVDLRPVYGRASAEARRALLLFSRPSTGSACKRLNLFLRWMVRQDGVDPGGWTTVPARQLVVPLDTHTIRVGKCLRLTRRASPGWKMAADITAALRAFDPDDPVRYDFALCHLSMMGACGLGAKAGDTQCPLRGHCVPRQRRLGSDRRRHGGARETRRLTEGDERREGGETGPPNGPRKKPTRTIR